PPAPRTLSLGGISVRAAMLPSTHFYNEEAGFSERNRLHRGSTSLGVGRTWRKHPRTGGIIDTFPRARRGSVHPEVHLLGQRRVTRVPAQISEQRVVFDKAQANVVLRKRAVEPPEGILAVAAPGMNLRDLPSRPIRLPLDQCIEGLLRFFRMSQTMLRQRHAGVPNVRSGRPLEDRQRLSRPTGEQMIEAQLAQSENILRVNLKRPLDRRARLL